MTDTNQDGMSEDREGAASNPKDTGSKDAGEGRKPRAGRMERLKAKARKLQGKSPDIYPMW